MSKADNVPWQNPLINEINREPAHAHFVPYINEANALFQQSLHASKRFEINKKGERRVSLNGIWKFFYSKTTIPHRQISINPNITQKNGII